ncbi:MAG TPA: hypothetical protein VHF47_05285 [Acidimicrobiales bacterium]|nr:hypothetical protein [Acidimicrobiales bacterium]
MTLGTSSAPVRPAAKPNGNQGGKPCDGCVGNADGKKPTHTKDSGYECNDRNNGVGKGNPAHSTCKRTTTPTTPTNTTPTQTTTTTTTPGTTTPTTVSTTPGTSVLGTTISRPAPAGTKVLGATLSRGALATTGGPIDPLGITALALGLVLLGRVLVRRSRTA